MHANSLIYAATGPRAEETLWLHNRSFGSTGEPSARLYSLEGDQCLYLFYRS